MKEQFDAMFLDVINGKSIRECEKVYGINRNTFVTMCKEIFPEGSEKRKKLEMVLSHSKSEHQQKRIDEKKLAEAIKGLCIGSVKTMEEAKELVVEKGDKIDLQTFRERVVDFINHTEDKDLRRKYIEYEAKKHPDYSNINFKALFVEMVALEASQTDMSRIYGIPRRTISRELEKLKEDKKYNILYSIAKEQSKRIMQRANEKSKRPLFNALERTLIDKTLEEFDEGEIIISGAKTEAEKKFEKAKKLLDAVSALDVTQKEAADLLGVSVSSIRRAGKTVESYQQMRKNENPDEDEVNR